MKNKIREIREKAGISQSKLATKIKIAQSNLSSLERGRLEAWPKVRRSLARVLKIPESELFPSRNGEQNAR